jgi:hypothetical protein
MGSAFDATAQDALPPSVRESVDRTRARTEAVNIFIDSVKKAGLPVSRTLLSKVSAMNQAVEMGVDVGEAAWEAEAEVKRVVANKKLLCADLAEEAIVCEARIERQWQARAVNYTLNPENEGSVVSRTLKKWFGADEDLGGINLDVKPEGTEADLGSVRQKVLELKDK